MAAVPSTPGTKNDEVTAACADLTRYLERLELLFPEPPSGHTKVSSYTRPTTPPAPGNGPALDAYNTAHEGLRRLEASLRRDVTGDAGPRRGSSEGNTHAALAAIPRLAAGLDSTAARLAARVLARWINLAKGVPGIDEARRWRALPKRAGNGLPPCCPYCHCYQLRADTDTGIVACFVPGCRDGQGQPPVAAMGTSEEGKPQLTWGDGRTESAPVLDNAP